MAADAYAHTLTGLSIHVLARGYSIRRFDQGREERDQGSVMGGMSGKRLTASADMHRS
jgi:hypothetical protein